MDPILGAAIVTAIQAMAELAKRSGMTRAELDKYFDETYAETKANIPGNLPDAR